MPRKPTSPTLKTREDLETAVGEICRHTILRDGLQAQMDAYIQEVRARYEHQLADHDKRLEELTAQVRQWAEANESAFGQARSLACTHGTIGWRKGMPQLKTISGWTWAKVLQFLQASWPQYIRTKPEIDKEQILADRELLSQDLARFGVKVHQAETFFVEPARTPAEQPRQQA